MRTGSPRALLAVLVAAVALPANAGGLYLYELSASDVGLGSAGWTARAHDGSTMFKNPAGMIRLEDGDLLVFGQGLSLQTQFTPDRALTTTSGSDGDASGFLPAGGLYYTLGISDDIKFGIGVTGYFGLALDYEDGWVGRYYVQQAQLQALTLQPTAAFRLGGGWSIGIGLAASYGILDDTIAINNTPVLLPGTAQPDGSLELDDTAWAFQGNLGLLWEGADGARFGLQYLSQASLNFSAVPEFNGLRPALQNALTTAGVIGTELDLGMKMPQAVRVGGAGDVGKKWSLFGDVGWEQWSRFGKVDVMLASDTATGITADLNFEDVWHGAIGAQRRFGDAWGLNFGFAYDTSMVEDANRTPSLPVGPAVRIGIGAEWKYGGGEVAFSSELVAAGDLPMDVNRGPLAGRVAGSYDGVGIYVLAASWRKVF